MTNPNDAQRCAHCHAPAGLRPVAAALDAALVRLRGAWLALCTCVDEFEPADMQACAERRDALDTAILKVLAAHEEASNG